MRAKRSQQRTHSFIYGGTKPTEVIKFTEANITANKGKMSYRDSLQENRWALTKAKIKIDVESEDADMLKARVQLEDIFWLMSGGENLW